MINRKKSSFFNRPRLLIVSGFTFALTLLLSSQAFASSNVSDISISIESLDKVNTYLAQHRGPPEGRGFRHGHQGGSCPDMDFEKGCKGKSVV